MVEVTIDLYDPSYPIGGTTKAGTKANPFFFQAEDGIRDTSVTGVQTCALPIFSSSRPCKPADTWGHQRNPCAGERRPPEIGRASCRERVAVKEVAIPYKKEYHDLVVMATYPMYGSSSLDEKLMGDIGRGKENQP